MDVAAASMTMSQVQVGYQASLSVMKSVMSMAEDTIAALMEGLEGAVEGLGENVDMLV